MADFTVAELTEAISYVEGEMGIGDLFMKIWDGEVDVLPEIPNIGKIDDCDTWGGEGDGAEMGVVIRIGDRYFQRTGYYSSWGSSEMDGEIQEVKPVQVMKTEYEAI